MPPVSQSLRRILILFATILSVPIPVAAQTPQHAAAEAVESLQKAPPEANAEDGLLQDAIEKMMCREFSRLTVRGYLHQGLTFNPASPRDRQNFGRLFDDRSNDYRLNQLMLTAEQAVDHARCFDWGFKAQLGAGTDARFTHATGTLEDVTNSPIQPEVNELNVTLHWKAGIAWDLKFGMYPALCGLESIDPTGNVLYSHTSIFNFGVPFKHTGVMLFAQVADGLQLMAGIDGGVNVGLNDNNGAPAFHAAAIGKLFCDQVSYTLATHYGPENPSRLGTIAGFDAEDESRWYLDLAATWEVNDRWKLMGDFNYGRDEAPVGIGGKDAEWYGGALYVVYKAHDGVDLVLRGEVFRDDDGFAVLQVAENDDLLDIQNGLFGNIDPRTVGGGAATYYAITFGANFRPCANLLIQTEVRYDRAAGGGMPFDDSSEKDQITFGLATLLTF
jgi:hypothetical protein